MARERKTIDEYLIEGQYDGVWEEVTREATRYAAQEQRALYIQAERTIRFRIRAVRVRIADLDSEYVAAHKAAVSKSSREMVERFMAKRKKYEDDQTVTYRRFIDINL